MAPIDGTETIIQDREAWFARAVQALRPRFEEIGYPLPAKIRVAVGFGPAGARKENAIILGVTLKRILSVDDVPEVWISPEDADAASMLATLIHELCHVADDCESGHKGAFAEMATRLGLEGPMTATVPSVTLAADLMALEASLGPYPGAQVDLSRISLLVPQDSPEGMPVPIGSGPGRVRIGSGPAPQKNRQILVQCTNEKCKAIGYKARTTRRNIDAFGAPYCPGTSPNSRSHSLTVME